MPVYYVYVLQDERNELYYGFTTDLRKRFIEHNSGKSVATKGQSWKLIYYEAYLAANDARKRERALKRYGQARTKLKQRITESLQQN